MTITKLIGGVALLASTFIGSALAQPVVDNPGRCQAAFPSANCQNLGPGNPYTDGGRRHRHRHIYHRSGRWIGRRTSWGIAIVPAILAQAIVPSANRAKGRGRDRADRTADNVACGLGRPEAGVAVGRGVGRDIWPIYLC